MGCGALAGAALHVAVGWWVAFGGHPEGPHRLEGVAGSRWWGWFAGHGATPAQRQGLQTRHDPTAQSPAPPSHGTSPSPVLLRTPRAHPPPAGPAHRVWCG